MWEGTAPVIYSYRQTAFQPESFQNKPLLWTLNFDVTETLTASNKDSKD